MTIHALHIDAGAHTVTVEVFGEHARLELRPAPGTGGGPEDTVAFEVPARALVAAVRASWADVHDARTFEPWRDEPSRHGPSRGGLHGIDDRPRRGDLGDGDPDGVHDGSVVPFPYRYPVRPPRRPRPARSGQPWEPEEEVTIRERWLAASPDADRDGLLAEIAATLERAAGGVAARLPQVGCDPYRPGCRLERSWTPTTGHPAGG